VKPPATAIEPDTISEPIKLNELNDKPLAQANPISVPVSRKLIFISKFSPLALTITPSKLPKKSSVI
jgi:hypothetical protein